MKDQEGADMDEMIEILDVPAMARIQALRRGIHVQVAATFARKLGFTLDQLCEVLGVDMPAARSRGRLSPVASERVLSLFRLVNFVDSLIERSGDPREFSAVTWLSVWLRQSNPALGGVRPVELLDTDEGMQMLARLIAQMESGAYA